MAADHIWDNSKFCSCVKEGLELVNSGIVVFGIKPSYPETGYGYLNFENNKLIKFVETQIGDYLEEDDIVRYQDDYVRV